MSRGAVVGVAGDGEVVRFDSAEVPANMALADYLKSGWIAGLQAGKRHHRPAERFRHRLGASPPRRNGISACRWCASKNRVYRFIFAARIDSELFARGAEETLRSFRAATQNDLRQIRKMEVRTVTAGAVDTADLPARRMAGVSNATNLFYILNNLYPGDAVTAGAAYKVVALDLSTGRVRRRVRQQKRPASLPAFVFLSVGPIRPRLPRRRARSWGRGAAISPAASRSPARPRSASAC